MTPTSSSMIRHIEAGYLKNEDDKNWAAPVDTYPTVDIENSSYGGSISYSNN